PTTPLGVTVTEVSYTKATVSWNAASDDTGIAGYDIYRNDKKMISVSGTSYTDKNLQPGTEYTYYPLNPTDEYRPLRYQEEEVFTAACFASERRVRWSGDCRDLAFLCYAHGGWAKAVYVTEAGTDFLDDFVAGNFSSYVLAQGYNETEITKGVVDSWNDVDRNRKKVNVQLLADLVSYDILGYDQTNSLAHICGRVYCYDSQTYWYVDYDSLDNTYFSFDGEFSYRRGTVAAVVLSEAEIAQIGIWSEAMTYRESEQPLETPSEPADPVGPAVIFILLGTPVGFFLPAALGVMSLVFTRSKRAQSPRRWYWLTACCLIWLLLSSLILMVFLLTLL
ncbi:MAG: fibronectin type III domain-containing protein, partial [Clostridia bacterium]|nr:fibronectin type III domain-containing protein [Clostridia bacterium]